MSGASSDPGRAVVVGSGPNGLTAAAVLATRGWQVDVYERADVIGGAASSSAVLGEGTVVDHGAAAHPFGVASPIFRALDLEAHGLTWEHSRYPMAHPMDDGPAGLLHRTLEETAAGLGRDGAAWTRLHRDVVEGIDEHLENFLGPLLRWPAHPLRLAAFGPRAVWPANTLTGKAFQTERARALFAGSAVHAYLPPSAPLTSAFGLLFGALGMSRGWPVARGGSGAITKALARVAESHGARIHTGVDVTDLRDLPRANATFLNLTARQAARLPGADLAPRVRRRLERWGYGAGAFKVDFLLDGPVPWTDPAVGEATTVHVGGSAEEIAAAEKMSGAGRLPDKPFVMVCQQQAADPSRADEGHVLWTYAHVPHGFVEEYEGQVAELIIAQIERFAPGFRDRIQRTVQTSPAELERWNPNLIGGDIAGGSMDGLNVLLRPGLTLDPYRLGEGLYLASGSTPPGAGVHGMPGAFAAQAAIADLERSGYGGYGGYGNGKASR